VGRIGFSASAAPWNAAEGVERQLARALGLPLSLTKHELATLMAVKSDRLAADLLATAARSAGPISTRQSSGWG
jgi:hypothetical protein